MGKKWRVLADKMADAVPADAKDDAEETSEDLADADEEEVAEPKEKRKGLVKRFGKKEAIKID